MNQTDAASASTGRSVLAQSLNVSHQCVDGIVLRQLRGMRLEARCHQPLGITGHRHLVRLADLRLRERYQDRDRGPFTGESQDHISVCEVTAVPGG